MKTFVMGFLFLLSSCHNKSAIQGSPPTTREVQKYPEEAKNTFPLFESRCSQCHGIGQATLVNSYLPSSWRNLVDTMRDKPDSHISSSEADKIYEFLVYDSSNRYKSTLEKQLNALPPDQQKQEREELQRIQDKFSR